VVSRRPRLVEHKKDVVILLDSITRLARAYNTVVPAPAKVLTGSVDPTRCNAQGFGAARNVEEGGSSHHRHRAHRHRLAHDDVITGVRAPATWRSISTGACPRSAYPSVT
jgi:hypothetical protein